MFNARLLVTTVRNVITKQLNPLYQPTFTRPIFTTTSLNEEISSSRTTARRASIRGTDRSQVIPVETSIRYMKSSAYQKTYGVDPVWKLYRRNHKGAIPPRKTRRTCIRAEKISTGNPCPICRDEYLVLHETNTDLLKQFISPYTGSIYTTKKTGLCCRKHEELQIAVQRARDRGLITFDIPFREYDYDDYYKS